MAKLGDLLKRQFAKLGIEITDDIKPLTELDQEVNDDVSGKIEKGLLTLESAKTNPEVTKAVKAAALNGIDSAIDEIIKESGVTMDESFANEKNTYTKVNLLGKALLETGRKKGEANSKDGLSETMKKERQTWQEKEAEYQRKLKEATETLTNKETEFKTTREDEQTTYELYKKLFGKDYVFPKDMDSDLKVESALSAIKKHLKSRGLSVKLNEAGVLSIVDKDGAKAYTEKHEPIDDANTYFDSILTSNKLLNINDPNAQSQQTQGSGAGTGQLNNGTNNKNVAIVNELQTQMKNMPA